MKHIIIALLLFNCFACSQNQDIKLVELSAEEKIEVYVNDQLFTAFLYSDTLRKQVLYPIFTASGKSITRGFPLDPQPGEKTDHPHHLGLWFNFGDVNGLDFWNNSYQVHEERKCRYGTIFCTDVEVDHKVGKISYKADWVDCSRNVLLEETTSYIFDGKPSFRSIIRKTTLSAINENIRLTENKEGLFALRMGRDFEEDVSGVYTNKEGDSKGDIWGKRSPWVSLSGTKENEKVSVVIIDHPDNCNYPGWWHARGYGLFAINNLGGTVFEENAEKVVVNINKGNSITFTYKVIIKNGSFISEEEINQEMNF